MRLQLRSGVKSSEFHFCYLCTDTHWSQEQQKRVVLILSSKQTHQFFFFFFFKFLIFFFIFFLNFNFFSFSIKDRFLWEIEDICEIARLDALTFWQLAFMSLYKRVGIMSDSRKINICALGCMRLFFSFSSPPLPQAGSS